MVKTRHTKVVDILIAGFVFILLCMCLLPVVNVAALSFSSEHAIVNQWVFLWPVEFNLNAYTMVLNDITFVRSIGLTALLTVVYTACAMVLTILCAYPLTQPNLKGKAFINTLIILTMYFNAGIIPNYILMNDLRLLDKFWVMIFPGVISVFNVLILKSFFYTIPDSLKESAQLDGANHFTVLIRIYLPLSTSALATLTLFYAVGRWNGFADALFYISNPKLKPIQLWLYQIIADIEDVNRVEGFTVPVATESVKAASVMFATVPILIVYPWLQRYFISGVTLGAVKG
jgi:putative aldouronate transport system permease protein